MMSIPARSVSRIAISVASSWAASSQGFGTTPQLARTHPHRRQMGQLVAVDQPVRLRIAADRGGRKKGLGHGRAFQDHAILAPKSRRIIRSSCSGNSEPLEFPCHSAAIVAFGVKKWSKLPCRAILEAPR